MSPDELTGIARAVAEQIDTAVADVLRQCDARIAGQQQAHAAQIAELQRSSAAEVATLRDELSAARHQQELDGQELRALRALATDPIAAVMFDAEGLLQVVQRNGTRHEARPREVPDVPALVEEAVASARDQISEGLLTELQAAVARCFELHFNAPAWSATAVYTEGQVVQSYVGRSYRLRAGIKASIGQEPGEHPEQWERLGTGGFRVFKSKPAAPQPGDVFTEAESRFMHDGSATILFVPKAPKVSDIERAVKAPHGLAQTAAAQVREVAGQLGDLMQDVQRGLAAANDASEHSIQALASTEQLRAEIEALRRRLDEIDPEAA